MNFSVVERPLPDATNQEHDFGLPWRTFDEAIN